MLPSSRKRAQGSNAQAPAWDEHSLNEQRFFNVVCWVYGANPQAFRGLVSDGILPEDRAERCPGEWAQIGKSWTRLLGASLKKEQSP